MELTSWLLSKMHSIGKRKYRLKRLIETERFREPSCKHCKKKFFGLPSLEFAEEVLPFIVFFFDLIPIVGIPLKLSLCSFYYF